MAELTDEQKAQLVLNEDDNRKVDDNQEDDLDNQNAENDDQEVEAQTDETENEEKPDDSEEAEAETPSFTKQFTNLKGDSWEEYGPELENAYQNSFSEALRLNDELKKRDVRIAELEAQVSGQGQQTTTGEQPQNPQPVSSPEIEYAKALMNNDMQTAFQSFSKQFPQALDQDNFDKFTKAADPVSQAFFATEGRQPLYAELFPKVAAYLGWQPADIAAKKDSAVKESLATQRNNSNAVKSSSKRTRVSDAQVDAYLRMYPAKSRADAVKELEEAVAS